MTYQELFDKVTVAVKDVKATSVEGHVAYQFNVVGEAEGIFYAEVIDKVFYVEPYDYYDNDVAFTATAEVFLDVFTAKKTLATVVEAGEINIDGDMDKAMLLAELVKAPAKKPAAKRKPAAKKEPVAKKEPAVKKEPAAKKEPVAKKPAAKTTTATKTTAAKTTATTKTTAAKKTTTK